jgi:hypothetical protein
MRTVEVDLNVFAAKDHNYRFAGTDSKVVPPKIKQDTIIMGYSSRYRVRGKKK